LKAQRKRLKTKVQGNENPAQGNENQAQGNENIESSFFSRMCKTLALLGRAINLNFLPLSLIKGNSDQSSGNNTTEF
jgi:hypothetical protein